MDPYKLPAAPKNSHSYAETALFTDLLKCNDQFRDLVMQMPVGVLIQNPESEITLCNPRALELLGLSVGQLLGKTSFDPDWNVVHVDGSPFPGATHPVPLAIASRAPVRNVEMGVFRPATQDRVWLRVDADPQFHPDGSVQQVICTFSDVTQSNSVREHHYKAAERQRAAQALQGQNAFIQAILDSVAVEMAVVAHNGSILAVNRAWRAFAAANAAQPGAVPAYAEVGSNYLSACPPRQALAAYPVDAYRGIRSVLDGELPMFRMEYPCHSPDQQRWFQMDVTPLGVGCLHGAVIVHIDITDKKLADLAQQERQADLAAAESIAHIGSWYWNARTDANQVSDELLHIFGLDAIPPFQQQCGLMYAPDTWATLHAAVQEAVRSGEGYNLELEAIHARGHGLWINTRCAAVLDADGKVVGLRGTVQDISDRKHAEQRIQQLAYFDGLTHLPNRTLLIDRLKQAITAGSRSGDSGAVLLIDLDLFKTLNDTRGHDMGDLLLVQVANRLSRCVREGDTVSRVGGDEFVLVLKGLNPDLRDAATQVEAIGKKILATLRQRYMLGTLEHTCTASLGATLFRGHDTSVEELLKQADLAIDKAKTSGRNRLRFFDPVMQTLVMERVSLEAGLRTAIHGGQLLLHYQPQVDGRGRVCGAEALVRWQHPVQGMVHPAKFIPVAEETGLILPLGNWVLHTACQQLASWAQHPVLKDCTIAVNVSAHQFRDTHFVTAVLRALRQTGARPERLKLELTESLFIDNVEDIIAKMLLLKTRGIAFSLDDFGTGYSSLAYLKRMPLAQLKIDQSFVRDILVDANDAAIARMVLALAQSLGLDVIAEGVETQAQADYLAQAGCHAYQGYYFGKPMPAQVLEALADKPLPG